MKTGILAVLVLFASSGLASGEPVRLRSLPEAAPSDTLCDPFANANPPATAKMKAFKINRADQPACDGDCLARAVALCAAKQLQVYPTGSGPALGPSSQTICR